MVHYLLICRSLTYAQRTAKVLEKSGIPAAITRAPQELAAEGCGYSVRVNARNYEKAREVLFGTELMPKRVYMRNTDGESREVQP